MKKAAAHYFGIQHQDNLAAPMVLVLHFTLRTEFRSHKIQIPTLHAAGGNWIPVGRWVVTYPEPQFSRAALLSSNAPNPLHSYTTWTLPVPTQPTHWPSPAPPPGFLIPLAWSTSCNLMLSLCNVDSSYLGKDCFSHGCTLMPTLATGS